MVCSREIPGDAKSPFVDHVFMCCYYEDWEPCRQVKKRGSSLQKLSLSSSLWYANEQATTTTQKELTLCTRAAYSFLIYHGKTTEIYGAKLIGVHVFSTV